jgi:hypothetical protein
MLNNKIGCCTIAALGHMIQLFTGANGHLFTPTDEEIRNAYSAISGYTPDNPGSDRGAQMLTAMNYWRRTGIAGHKIDAFAEIDTRGHIRIAMLLFGAVNAGFQLPISAQQQFQMGHVWSATGIKGYSERGSWGGHDVFLVDYNPVGPVCVTWGKLQQMTWKFWDMYADEAFVPLSSDWVTREKEAPSGFDFDRLFSDLARL